MYELFPNLEGIEAVYTGPDKRLVSFLRFYNSKKTVDRSLPQL